MSLLESMLQEKKETLTEAAKSLEAALKFFDESDEDDDYQYYDIKEGYVASGKHDNVVVLGISPDKKKFTMHTEERGEMKSTEDAIANLTIFKLQKVY